MDTKDFPLRKPAVAIAIGAKPESGEVKFPAPEGFDTAGKEPGSTMEVVAEITFGEDGMIELKSINGMPVGEKHDAMDEATPKDTFANRVMPDEGEEA